MRSRHQHWVVLAVCSLSVLIVQIDATGMNLALRSVARQMDASNGQLQWIIDAHLVVLASLLMFSVALADRVGRRKVLLTGLVIFGTGSLLCSLATDPLVHAVDWRAVFCAHRGAGDTAGVEGGVRIARAAGRGHRHPRPGAGGAGAGRPDLLHHRWR
ncbi:MAG: MFS transporter [Pseudomonadota bacterium]|nr:MFS transporter [Pseudomonadota bacterium]